LWSRNESSSGDCGPALADVDCTEGDGEGMTPVGVGTGGEVGGGAAGPLVTPDGVDCTLGAPGLGDRAGLATAEAVAAAVGLVQSTTALTGVDGAGVDGAGG
jgi:hypothetical protein